MMKLVRSTATAVCAGVMLATTAVQAEPWGRPGYGGPNPGYGAYVARRQIERHRDRRDRKVAGAVAAGAALGLIGGAIVASQVQQAQRERDAAAAYYGRRDPSYYGY